MIVVITRILFVAFLCAFQIIITIRMMLTARLLYVPRKRGGCGLLSVEDFLLHKKLSLAQ